MKTFLMRCLETLVNAGQKDRDPSRESREECVQCSLGHNRLLGILIANPVWHLRTCAVTAIAMDVVTSPGILLVVRWRERRVWCHGLRHGWRRGIVAIRATRE